MRVSGIGPIRPIAHLLAGSGTGQEGSARLRSVNPLSGDVGVGFLVDLGILHKLFFNCFEQFTQELIHAGAITLAKHIAGDDSPRSLSVRSFVLHISSRIVRTAPGNSQKAQLGHRWAFC